MFFPYHTLYQPVIKISQWAKSPILKIHRRIKQGVVRKRVCITIFYYILHFINKRNAPSTSRTSNLINFFFYNINLKRHVAEGLDIVIVKNMCDDVSLQIIYIVYDHYRLVYYNDTVFTVAHWIQLASFPNVQVEKRQHQLREFLQIQVRPLKHLNNFHMLSKRSGSSVRTWNITLLWPIMTANGVSYRINLFPSLWRI